MKSKIINQLNQKDTELNSVIETILETETIIQMLESNYYQKSMENADVADVNINHLGIIRGLFKHFNIDTATQREVMVVIDKGDKDLLKESLTGENPIIDNEELNHVLFKLIDMVGDKSIIKDIEELVAPYPESHDALNELEELIDTLASFKMENYTLNLGVARGLD